MDESTSRLSTASFLHGIGLPVGIYANAHGTSMYIPEILLSTMMTAAPFGAIILGHVSRGQVRRSGYIRGGYGLGTAGMILGYLTLAAIIYFIILMRMTPGFRH
jgi:hypothetical protein